MKNIVNYKSPKIVKFREPMQIKQIAAGGHHSLVLISDGRLYGCGKNTHGELGLGELNDELLNLEKGVNEFV
jgi:hypothetical protein